MKTVYLFIVSSLLALTSFAQNNVNPFPRTITVNGSAEMEITPDEIYVQVYLKEYEKKGSGKISIEKIRQNFLTAVRSLGLPDSSVTVSGYDPQELALVLDSAYRVQVRSGLHCAPLMHRSLGTLADGGTLRFSLGAFSTSEEIEAAIGAMREIAAGG